MGIRSTQGLRTMTHTSLCFTAPLLRPADTHDNGDWAFAILPKAVSEQLPRRGRTSVDCVLLEQRFRVTLEPDGKLSHWIRIPAEVLQAAGIEAGSTQSFQITPAPEEPEPDVPTDLQAALDASPESRSTWDATTTLARVDWIHWIESAKQARTREKRIRSACDQLASGKRRVCCFDTSGYYSKALSSPEPLEG